MDHNIKTRQEKKGSKGKDRNKAADDTLLLEPGDIIYVPERLI